MNQNSTKKCGSVEPQSDFQSELTKSPLPTGVPDTFPSPVPAPAPARALYVLIACEESQAECIAFRELGHIAYSCDIQPCRPKGHPEWHIHHDVTPFLNGLCHFFTQDGTHHVVPRWDLIIAHPPCTYLCRASAVQMKIKGRIDFRRWCNILTARNFFYLCLNAQADFVAVENPIPLKRAKLPPPSCYLEPSWFGVKYTKKTLYWLKNLPPIVPEIEYPNPKSFVYASRGKYRSRTFPQVARALARQWSDFILRETENR